jgi:peptidoglycan/LPS O-acetylase OafA/YrhL
MRRGRPAGSGPSVCPPYLAAMDAPGSTGASRPTERDHQHTLPPLADPGKQDRSAHGIPVVPEFDGYRAFAIFAILSTHLLLAAKVVGGPGGGWGNELMTGLGAWLISILFIVSGFVVFLPTVARGGEFRNVGGYALRRAARLLPAYWVTMLIVLVLIAALPSRQMPGWGDMAVTFAGQDTWAALFHHGFVAGFNVNWPVWSLTLEIGFYIVLPFIASAYFRRPLLGLAIAAILSIGWRLGFANLPDLAGIVGIHVTAGRAAELRLASYNQLPSWAFAFGAGMSAAWAYVSLPHRFGREKVARIARIALPASIAALAICAYFSGRYALGSLPIAAQLEAQRNILLFLAYIGSIAAAMLALSLSGLRSPFASPLARNLGDISYGVFLSQIPVLWALFQWTNVPRDGTLGALLLLTVIVVPVCIAYGYLSARFLEQPIRRWARRFGRRAEGRVRPERSPGVASAKGDA